MTDIVLQPNTQCAGLLLEALIAARGAAAPWFNLKTIRLLEGLVNGTEVIDSKTWLNLTNMVKFRPGWAGKLALLGVRMPTPAEAFEQMTLLRPSRYDRQGIPL